MARKIQCDRCGVENVIGKSGFSKIRAISIQFVDKGGQTQTYTRDLCEPCAKEVLRIFNERLPIEVKG